MKKIDSFTIGVGDILKEGTGANKRQEIQLVLNDFNQELKLTQPVNGFVDLTNIDQDIQSEFQLDTVLKLDCCRCLKPFEYPLKLQFQTQYNNQDSIEQEEINLIESNEVDILPVITQEILLNIPLKPLCQPNCPGIKGVKVKKE